MTFRTVDETSCVHVRQTLSAEQGLAPALLFNTEIANGIIRTNLA